MVLGGFEWFWVVLGGFWGRDDPKSPENGKENCLERYFRIYVYMYIYIYIYGCLAVSPPRGFDDFKHNHVNICMYIYIYICIHT